MKKGLFAGLIALGIASATYANVSLSAIFSDHAVLQRSERVPVWGKAAAGEKVTVTLDKATASATAGADGKWQVALNL
jgi:sialate O-acetylesterase